MTTTENPMPTQEVGEMAVMRFELGRLPGVKPEKVDAWLIHLAQHPETAQELIRAATQAAANCSECPNCFAWVAWDDNQECPWCSATLTDSSILCIVEEFDDLAAIAAAQCYDGAYHVLQGRLSEAKGKSPAIGPEDIRLPELKDRITELGAELQEIILSLSQDPDGARTEQWIIRMLQDLPHTKPVISRPAPGMPTGTGPADLPAADLLSALRRRKPGEP